MIFPRGTDGLTDDGGDRPQAGRRHQTPAAPAAAPGPAARGRLRTRLGGQSPSPLRRVRHPGAPVPGQPADRLGPRPSAGQRTGEDQRATGGPALQPGLFQRVGPRLRPREAAPGHHPTGRRDASGQRRPAAQDPPGPGAGDGRRDRIGRHRHRRRGGLDALPGRDLETRLEAARPVRLRLISPDRRRADRRPQLRQERREVRAAHQAQARLLLRDRPLVRPVQTLQRHRRRGQLVRLLR
jgi:hypothetical protein